MTLDPNRPSSGAADIVPLSPSVASDGQRPERPDAAVVDGPTGHLVRRLQVRGRAGIWEVTRDDRFYGHYIGYEAAFAAAEAEATTIVAGGGSADLRFRDGRPQPARGAGGAPSPAMHIMEFRPGLARVVR